MRVLFLDCTVRPAGISRSRMLADEFFATYKQLNPRVHVDELILRELSLMPHTWESLQKRDELLAAGKTDDPRFALAHQFAQADKIVVCAPFWDLSFPALFKLYIENVSVGGITFGFDGNRMFGRCRCQKLLYITTRGGDFGGADAWMESALPQLRAFSEMFSLGDITCVCAEGIDIEGRDYEGLISKAKQDARLAAESF